MIETLKYLNKMRQSGVIGKYAVGGAMAATFYIEPVSTYDLDVFVVLPQSPDDLLISLTPLYNHLREDGFQEEKECVIIKGVPVQFLPAFNPLVEEALDSAEEKEYDVVKVPVFSAEHLVAVALQTGRQKDKMRVLAFVESGILDNIKVFEIIKRHGLEEKWKNLTSILI